MFRSQPSLSKKNISIESAQIEVKAPTCLEFIPLNAYNSDSSHNPDSSNLIAKSLSKCKFHLRNCRYDRAKSRDQSIEPHGTMFYLRSSSRVGMKIIKKFVPHPKIKLFRVGICPNSRINKYAHQLLENRYQKYLLFLQTWLIGSCLSIAKSIRNERDWSLRSSKNWQ